MRRTAFTAASLCAGLLALTGAAPAAAAATAVQSPSSPGTVSTTTATQTLAVGTDEASPDVLVDRRRRILAATQTVVAGTSAAAAATGASAPSGQAMPTAALAGWTRVFADDFTTPVATGSFPGSAYSKRWDGYSGFTDTSGVGTYTPSRVVSVTGGKLDMRLHSEGGKALTAAPVPLVNGKWGGWTYGRYSIRFRSDAVAGYKTAWMLWPDSNNWNDGEIDFPEGELNGTMNAFVHQPGNPSRNALAVSTGVTYTGWHTATIEWLPSGVTFLLDGRQVGRTTVSPSKPLHVVLQTETSGRPSSSAAGHVQVDWITMHRRS